MLQAINRYDYLALGEISDITKIPYSSAWRIVSALEYEGIIERDHSKKYYRATALAQSLSYGYHCLLYTSPSPRDLSTSRMPSSA